MWWEERLSIDTAWLWTDEGKPWEILGKIEEFEGVLTCTACTGNSRKGEWKFKSFKAGVGQ